MKLPKKCHVEKFLTEEMVLQCWAEAWHLYHEKGHRANLPFRLWKQQEAQADEFRDREEFDEDRVMSKVKLIFGDDPVKLVVLMDAA